jgi:ATP-binding cassette, subfamily C, bacterial LapB
VATSVTMDDEAARPERAEPDPLLSCLLHAARHFGRPMTREALLSRLPWDGKPMTTKLFIAGAETVGLKAEVKPFGFGKLIDGALPAVVVTRDGSALLLTAVEPDGTVAFYAAEADAQRQTAAAKALKPRYGGYAITLTAVPERVVAAAGEAATGTEAEERQRARPWFWPVLARNWWIYAQVLLAALLINLFGLAMPIFTMLVYDRVVPNGAVETLWVLAIGTAGVLLFDLVIRLLRGHFIEAAGARADVAIASVIFEQVMNIRLEARPASAGAFASILREFETVREFFTSATLATLVDLPFMLLFVLVIWIIGGPLAWVTLAVLPLILIAVLLVQIPLARAVRHAHAQNQERHGVLVEAITGLEAVKTAGAAPAMRAKWETLVALTAISGQSYRWLAVTSLNFSLFFQQLATVVVVLLGALLIADNQMTSGQLVAAVLLTGRAVVPLAQFAQLLSRWEQSLTAYRALKRLMRSPVERPLDRQYIARPTLQGGIGFRQVSLTYRDRPVPALDRVSCDIRAGERVGVIGAVGSGKSSMIKLVLGLYQPSGGAVLVDGTDLRQIDPADLRRNIGCVPQDAYLFRGSVRDNIVIGMADADDARVLEAAKLAGVDEFVRTHPLGYNLPVGERGENLSGGQRQAVALARALLRQPPILLLDEPTNGMDTAMEEAFKVRLSGILQGRTLLLVTHRRSLLTLVDRLILLQNGAVIADGPRDQVLARLGDANARARPTPVPTAVPSPPTTIERARP